MLFSKKRICIGEKCSIIGKPIVICVRRSEIRIGRNVTLNSVNKTYHLNMHSRVKLIADRPGAEIVIGDNCRIHGSCIHAYSSITIGSNCLVAANCQIFDGNGHGLSFQSVEDRINTTGGAKEIVIGDNVWLGANVIVLPGVHIGYGSIISAGSVVCYNIPEMSIARGNPAMVIKSYKQEDS